MIEVQGNRWVVAAPMTLDQARLLLAAGEALLQPGAWTVDLSRVEEADSSALAVMLGWLRAADLARSTLVFTEIPAGVKALAELYGLTDLLPQA